VISFSRGVLGAGTVGTAETGAETDIRGEITA
jgi:hypothetical protein